MTKLIQGCFLGWESPASFKGTLSDDREKSHICYSPTHRLTHTLSFRLSGKEVMWQKGFWHMSPLPGSKGLQSLMSTAAPWSLLLAEYNPAWGQDTHAAAASGCPQANPQCILRSPVFPHWKSDKVPLASTSLWLLDRGRQSQTQHPSHVPDRGGGKTPHPSALIGGTRMLQLFLTECTGREPRRGRKGQGEG